MHCLKRFETIVGDISYKDWKFRIGVGTNTYFLQTVLTDKVGSEWYGRKWLLSPHMTDSEFVQTVLKAVLTAEEHEARERFFYRNRAIFGPHLNVQKLYDLLAEQDSQELRKNESR